MCLNVLVRGRVRGVGITAMGSCLYRDSALGPEEIKELMYSPRRSSCSTEFEKGNEERLELINRVLHVPDLITPTELEASHLMPLWYFEASIYCALQLMDAGNVDAEMFMKEYTPFQLARDEIIMENLGVC